MDLLSRFKHETEKARKRVTFKNRQSVLVALEPNIIPVSWFVLIVIMMVHGGLFLMDFENQKYAFTKIIAFAFAIVVDVIAGWLAMSIRTARKVGGSTFVVALLTATLTTILGFFLQWGYYWTANGNELTRDMQFWTYTAIAVYLSLNVFLVLYVRSGLDEVAKVATQSATQGATGATATQNEPVGAMGLQSSAMQSTPTVAAVQTTGKSDIAVQSLVRRNGAHFDAEFKSEVVAFAGLHSNRKAANKYGVSATTVDRWVREAGIR